MGKPSRLRNKGIKAVMLQILVATTVFYVVLVTAMFALQRSFLYHPESYMPSPAESGVASMVETHFVTEDGLDLVAWTEPPRVAQKPWVVIFHGNAGTMAGRAFKAKLFLNAGYGVMLVEYRGYGGNPGHPTEEGLFADARAALNYLTAQGIAGEKLVLYGESLGTGVAVTMATEFARAGHPVAALVLEAPFTSTADVAAKHYPYLPARMLLKDRFDSLSRIQDIKTALFVAHGSKDWTVPQKLGRILFAAAPEPKEALWIEGGGHSDLFQYGLGEAILAFLKGRGL
jgi:hypothetical protein